MGESFGEKPNNQDREPLLSDADVIALINERPERLLAGNYERSERILNEQAEAQGLSVEEFNEKSQRFLEYYQDNTFDQVVHVADDLVGAAEVGEVTDLQSPKHGNREASGSGTLDETIGNTHYAFAAFNQLIPASAAGRYKYEVVSEQVEQGHAVPLDIGVIHSPYREGELGNSETMEAQERRIYLHNIYRYPDFVQIFSRYNALLFDEPADAIAFYRKYRRLPDVAAVWVNDNVSKSRLANDNEYQIFQHMKALYKEHMIAPPFSPELQYKVSVKARRIK